MIVINDKVLAENNDINTVLSEDELFDGVLCVSSLSNDRSLDKKINSFDSTYANQLLVSNSNGRIIGVLMKPNSYLCIDVNGDIMFKGE